MSERRLFRTGSMVNTPLDDEKFLSACNIEIVEHPSEADIVVARSLKQLTAEHLCSRHLVVTWTHEPKWDATPSPLVRSHFGIADVHVFNVYNWNVYTDNFFYAPFGRPLAKLTMQTLDVDRFNRRGAAVYATRRVNPLEVRGVDYALDVFRSEMALGLRALGLCDIYGRGWPAEVATGESREGKWGQAKISGLSDYAFSLCCENTNFDNYVTEKLWQCLEGGALPLYWINDTLKTVFPPDSVIDLSNPRLREPGAVADTMRSMSAEEYVHRYNTCVDVYNFVAAHGLRERSRARSRNILAALIA